LHKPKTSYASKKLVPKLLTKDKISSNAKHYMMKKHKPLEGVFKEGIHFYYYNVHMKMHLPFGKTLNLTSPFCKLDIALPI